MITTLNTGSPFIAIHKYQEQHGENASISLSSEGEAIMAWARDKMMEEQRLERLAQDNPTVADAISAVKKAEEQLKMVVALVE